MAVSSASGYTVIPSCVRGRSQRRASVEHEKATRQREVVLVVERNFEWTHLQRAATLRGLVIGGVGMVVVVGARARSIGVGSLHQPEQRVVGPTRALPIKVHFAMAPKNAERTKTRVKSTVQKASTQKKIYSVTPRPHRTGID